MKYISVLSNNEIAYIFACWRQSEMNSKSFILVKDVNRNSLTMFEIKLF